MRRRHNHIRASAGDWVFLTINFLLLTAFFILLIYPLLFVIIASFSGQATTMTLSLWPKTISWTGYEAVFEYYLIWVGYRNSLFYLVLATIISLIVTICCAYPLSRSNLKGGSVMMGLCVFTMYFSGGLIPTYLLIRDLKMLDSIWSLILPGSLSVFNMIVMRTYFKTQIPEELLEASQLDGCSDFYYLIQIVLPLSGPIIAVIALYVAVGQWNSYFDALVYISTREKLPLPVFLREILVLNSMESSQQTATQLVGSAEQLAALERRKEIMKYSLIVVSSAPVMAIYPFVQRFFVKGVMIGAIKG
jgi:putative aldouronate transport system permease protein